MWSLGDRVWNRFNLEMGPGWVVESNDRHVMVQFLEGGERLRFAASTDALVPLIVTEGVAAWLEDDGSSVVVEALLDGDRCRLEDGRIFPTVAVWPLPEREDPIEALARGDIDSGAHFLNRLDALRLEMVREAQGLGSFLGGRIRLYPHQLYAAERACATDPVRWLLADGVGLGKTVEACLIMNRLIHTGRAERTVVVAPDALTVQWLGELWRKHHHTFVLLDEKRIADVEREQAGAFNPFEVHRQVVIAIETLCAEPRLVTMAVEAGIDLLVIDEAHHLQRPLGHSGNPAYRAIESIASQGRNVLLLTATPLEDDALGFLRLVELLRPDEFGPEAQLMDRLEVRIPLPPCTSATRAVDIGGWPPRTPQPVPIGEAEWRPFERIEQAVRGIKADTPVAKASKARLVFEASAAPTMVPKLMKVSDPEIEALAVEAGRNDPRLAYLIDRAPNWRKQGDKTLIFVARRESLELIKTALERRAHLRVALFHEDMPTRRRDVEVAQFSLPTGPSILLTTECGGEGRNFQMCRRLVLFDLPWQPGVVEQRIGRLDRIGRDRPTEIVYFRPPSGMGGAVVRLYEAMGLFEQSLGGIDRELRHIGREVERVAVDGPKVLETDIFEAVLKTAEAARTRVQEAAFHQLHRDPYRESMADGILGRVPQDLESLTKEVILAAAAAFGFEVEQQRGEDRWFIALGGEALVENLPGVPDESRFLGTFNREEAVTNESLDFFSSGHPLVEGVLEELQQGNRGRTACFVATGDEEVFGLLALFKREGEIEAVVVDAGGLIRPDLAEALTAPECDLKPADGRRWASLPGWADVIRRMAAALPDHDVPQALAAFRINPDDSKGGRHSDQ
ncbi:MAG: hypothetical protein DRJ65_08355 [Acidobacteria bacterium]|nr:MAG: hypothetical protein DRJ65_08355 [Acidobacteriota bacterium]